MLARKNRIYVKDGVEYRLVAGKPVEGFPQDVVDALVALELVVVPTTPPKKRNRRASRTAAEAVSAVEKAVEDGIVTSKEKGDVLSALSDVKPETEGKVE